MSDIKLIATHIWFIMRVFASATMWQILKFAGLARIDPLDGEPTDSAFRHAGKQLVEWYYRMFNLPMRPCYGHWSAFKSLVGLIWAGKKAERKMQRQDKILCRYGIHSQADLDRLAYLAKIGNSPRCRAWLASQTKKETS